MHRAFYFLIALAQCLRSLSAATAPTRHLSDETRALIDSRLIFVYDEDGCREMEGHGAFSRFQSMERMPIHRSLALSELERRLDAQIRLKQLTGAGLELESKSPEFVIARPPLRTVYLEALEMEIAHVPEGMTLLELEEASESLPCVKFVARDDVKFAERDELLDSNGGIRVYPERSPGPAKSILPADPLYRYQWGLHRGNSSTFGIDVERVWSDFDWQGKDNMVIAIIDSGCNLQHPDMQGQFWQNPGETDCNDGIDNDGNGLIDDCFGWDFVDEDNYPQAEGTSHGTAAAGIIAARSNNNEGIAGICTNCRLMCLRFISNTEGTVANEVRAIDYAVRMGAKISNNSYGGYAHYGSRVEQEAIERADKRGHIFISSAGNNNINSDESEYIHTPSGYAVKNVIAVGASTENGRKSSFSNWGRDKVHVFAPGRNVISTGRDGYLVNQGTSFAAPHVAGIAGLIWSKFPALTSDQLVSLLLQSCRATPDLKGLSRCDGVVNAYEAMTRAEEMARKGYTSNDESSLLASAVTPTTGRTPVEGRNSPPAVVAFEPSPLEGAWAKTPRLPTDLDILDFDFSDSDQSALDFFVGADPIEAPVAQSMRNLPWQWHHAGPHSVPATPVIVIDPATGLNYTTYFPTTFLHQGLYPLQPAVPVEPIIIAPTTTTTTTVPSIAASVGVAPVATYLLPANDMIWTHPATDLFNTAGVRASSLPGGGWLPAAKRLIKAPIHGAIELVNTGLEWVPNLSRLANNLSPAAIQARVVPATYALVHPYGPYSINPHVAFATPDGAGQVTPQISQASVDTLPMTYYTANMPEPLTYPAGMMAQPQMPPTIRSGISAAGLSGGLLNDVGEMVFDFFDGALSGFSHDDSAAGFFDKLARDS